ncbi:MAG: SIS domain-containing protein [Pyrinomonadaceae bacterium]
MSLPDNMGGANKDAQSNGETITAHFIAHQRLVEQSLRELPPLAAQTAAVLIQALRRGHKVIAFGNGGSATQASHLVAELLGRFNATRQPFPAIALASDSGTTTCISNDFGFDVLFERQVTALAQPGDIAVGLTTSGRSENVRRGLLAARERGAITIALTGAAGLVEGTADYILVVPGTSTANIQEVHLMLLHAWCLCLDQSLGV